MSIALVIQSISGILKIKDLETSEILFAELKGTLLKEKNLVFPGDEVEFKKTNDINIINNIHVRKNFLLRPKISNIDFLVIVQSFKEPNANIRFLNKFILFFQSQKIDNIILFFTKFDILNKKEKDNAINLINHFKNDNFQVFKSGNLNDFIQFINKLENNIICFTGQSGVGKSTLLNKIDNEFNIKTNEISKSLNRGKHTTTATFLYEKNKNYLVDTPGFSTIDLNMTPFELSKGYSDFRKYSLNCKFNNCLHDTEFNCEIKNKVREKIISEKRYEDYLYFLRNIK